MEELCPNAWLINFANPAGMVTEAVLRYTNIQRVVGLCNVPIGIRMGLARLLEVDASRVHVDFAGLNHMVYGLDVYLDGVSVMDRVLELVTDPEKQITMENIAALTGNQTLFADFVQFHVHTIVTTTKHVKC